MSELQEHMQINEFSVHLDENEQATFVELRRNGTVITSFIFDSRMGVGEATWPERLIGFGDPVTTTRITTPMGYRFDVTNFSLRVMLPD